MLKVVGASWVQTTVSLAILLGILIFGVVIIVYCTNRSEDDGKFAATVFWNPYTEGYDISLWGQNNDPSEISRGAARAYYQSSMHETGWAVLEIETNEEYADDIQAFAAGILEGSLSWQHIYWQWTNTIEEPCEGQSQYCDYVREFLTNNTNYVRKMAVEKDRIDPFWHQINLFYIQLDGIEFGWRYEMTKNKESYTVPKVDFLWMNMISDFKFGNYSTNRTNDDRFPAAMSLVKMLSKNHSDFLIAHASSGLYNSMLRIQKRYKFNYRCTGTPYSNGVSGRTISFTSYPASIHSQDDFYQILNDDGTKVTITGTKLNESYKRTSKLDVEQVLQGPRTMASNRLANNGETWSTVIRKQLGNIGNKQWLHISTKDDTIRFWVIEQISNSVIAKDKTTYLYECGYWINCGSSYYLQQKENDENNRNNYTFAQNISIVLSRGQMNVTSIESLIRLMRSPDVSLVGRTDLYVGENKLSNATRDEDGRDSSSVERKSSKLIYVDENALNLIVTFDESKQRRRAVRLKRVVSLIKSASGIDSFSNYAHTRKNVEDERPLNVGNSYNGSFNAINGIIDLKVSQNNENFLAAAGPPFSRDSRRRIEPFQWSKSRINYLPHNGHSDRWDFQPFSANFVW